MHNIKEIRKDFDAFSKALKKRSIDIDLNKLKKLDIDNRDLIQKKETLEKEKKDISKTKDKALFSRSKEITKSIDKITDQQSKIKSDLDEILSSIPNITHDDVPIGSNENGNFIKSVADNAASGLGKEVKIDLNKTPFINITWKVEKDLSGIKENTKKGHDFAARVFAVKKTGATPLSNRAINYVFSSNNEIGFSSPSPYTKKSIDNVLSSTKNNLNQWVTVKANVKEDFKKFHDLDVNELDGLAIMSDTDNSKMKAIAYFQNIYFSTD